VPSPSESGSPRRVLDPEDEDTMILRKVGNCIPATKLDISEEFL
jgi:hypothetical protein